MNREIKFRAWDVKRSEMNTEFLLSNDGHILHRVIGLTHVGLDKDNAILMQFTGLKDIIGIDVYEGDVFGPLTFNNSISHGVVVFENGEFVVKATHGEQWYRTLFSAADEAPVIGNIYENPELIGN